MPTAGVSTYNVIPDQLGAYFNKIQCFCFEQQRLRPGESVDMPVFFYIDPEMCGDFNLRNTHDVTLSYTFFKIDDADLDEEDLVPGVRTHGPDSEGAAAMAAKLGIAPGAPAPAAAMAAAAALGAK